MQEMMTLALPCKVIAVRTDSLSAATYLPQTCGLLLTPISFPTGGQSEFIHLWCGAADTDLGKMGGPGLWLQWLNQLVEIT